jgi:uncharacterized C2H2 Zn-finger protein
VCLEVFSREKDYKNHAEKKHGHCPDPRTQARFRMWLH